MGATLRERKYPFHIDLRIILNACLTSSAHAESFLRPSHSGESPTHPPPMPMSGTYDPVLVTASVLIAVLAAFVAVAMAARVTSASGRFRAAWLAAGSVAMGIGIWGMHFVGMLAFRLPVPVAYHGGIVILSALVPVLAAALALYVASRRVPGRSRTAGAALLMGAAIAGMHYLGMAAMRVPARSSHDPWLVAASLAIAVGASWAALGQAVRFRDDEPGRRGGAKLVSALLLGGGIAGMHYTAMAAARFDVRGSALFVPGDYLLQTNGLATAVTVATLAVLLVALLGTLVDRRMRARSAETEALRRSEDRFRSLVTATTQVIWTADATGQVTEEQPDWGAFTGTPFHEYRGSGWLRSLHPADRESAAEAWREAVEERRTWEIEYRVRRHDGEWRRMEARAVPVLEPDGRLREWVRAETDVTERRRDAAAREFLSEASRVLASSLDYETTLSTVAWLAVPDLADWCAVDVLDQEGRVRRVAVAHQDPEKIRSVQELEERYPTDPDSPHGVPHVLRTGDTQVMEEIPDELLVAAAKDEEHLRLIRELGLRSYVAVPLVARGRVLGALSMVSAESGRRYDERDRALAEELARRAAVAVDNARLFHETEESREQLEQQAGELQEAQAEMELAHDELLRANEELLTRTEEAERARAAADEANEAKSAFLATMSHELRTPLNAIGGYAQLLELGIHGPLTEAQRESLERIRRNQAHLLGLINDVLNFAKVEAGQVRYEIDDVPLDETLAAVEALIGPQLASRRLRYTYRRGDPRETVRADRERLEQVVLNLLTNAVKFTEPGGEVRMEWEADGARTAIRVRDTGRGIPPEKLQAIFEPFVQVDPALTRSAEGTGLGLAISRDLARAMGGDLTVQSEPDRGSTFTFTLPRCEPRADAAPAREREPAA